MPMPERVVCDQDVRDRVTGDLGTTFLLEAGAGTGKTSVLVDRYVQLRARRRAGTGDVRTVAAITFTEKAAGELRQRVREEFEARGRRGRGTAPRRPPIERALDGARRRADQHHPRLRRRACCASSRSRPASTPPSSSSTRSAPRSSAPVSGRSGSPSWPPATVRTTRPRRGTGGACASGSRACFAPACRLDDVRELAIGPGVFGERYDLDRSGRRPTSPTWPPAWRARGRRWRACARSARRRAATGATRASPPPWSSSRPCERSSPAPPADLDQLAAALCACRPSDHVRARRRQGQLGRGARRQGRAAGGATRPRSPVVATCATPTPSTSPVSPWPSPTRSRAGPGEAQLGLGRLDFTDLLGRLRDLLSARPGARRALQRRFRYLLVDEFQDTDPLQAEIVFFLCEREPQAADWRDVVLEPGKLFVVGDPKQSIYRFRRADIALYDEVKELVAEQPGGTGVVTAIRQNFRTTPAVVAWVNNVFAGVFDERQRARAASRATSGSSRTARPADGPRVAVLLGPRVRRPQAGETDAARRDEARAVAALLAACTGDAERWLVHERRRGEATESRRARRAGATSPSSSAPPPGSRRSSRRCARPACRTASTAARPTSSGARSTTRCSACAPSTTRSDGPAVYGALHSSLFGFSDDDLVLFWAAGGRFDLFAARAAAGARGGRRRRSACCASCTSAAARAQPHELVGRAAAPCHAREMLAATGAGAPQAIANLDKLVERARAFAGAGGGGLGAFLAWAAEAGDAAGEQESQVDDNGDVVHLLTIHKAKGLEYPDRRARRRRSGGGGGGARADRRPRRAPPGVKLQGGAAGHGGRRRSSRGRTRVSTSVRSR